MNETAVHIHVNVDEVLVGRRIGGGVATRELKRRVQLVGDQTHAGAHVTAYQRRGGRERGRVSLHAELDNGSSSSVRMSTSGMLVTAVISQSGRVGDAFLAPPALLSGLLVLTLLLLLLTVVVETRSE